MPPPSRSVPRTWRAPLCGCCDDPGACCLISFCQCNAAGQLFQRTAGYGCLGVSALLWTLFVVTQVLGDTSSALAAASPDGVPMDTYLLLSSLAAAAGFSTTVVGTVVLCTVRGRIRARDQIPGDAVSDCCTSYWCGFCAMVQMLRQENAYVGYRPCTVTAV